MHGYIPEVDAPIELDIKEEGNRMLYSISVITEMVSHQSALDQIV